MIVPQFTDRNRAVNPVIGTVLLIGMAVILSASIGTFLIGIANDMNDVAYGVVEVTDVNDETEGFVSVKGVSLNRADRITVTVTDADDGGRLDGGTSELTGEIQSAGETVTFRQESTYSGDVPVEIVAIAVYGDDSTLIHNEEYTI